MRCYPLLALCIVFSGCLPFAQARVGETRSEMENRLTRDRRVIEYPERYLDRKMSDRHVTYRNHLSHFPEGSVHALYYKKANNAPVSRSDLDSAPFPDGWDLHVVYFKNISVFEVYRRNGAALTAAEINALLALNRGDSFWNKVNRREQQQVWQADFVLEDGTMLASRSGNLLIFYRPEFEAIVRERIDEMNKLNREDEEQRAPLSVQGF